MQGQNVAALMDKLHLAQQQEEANRRDAPKGHYDFWETQPVPQFNQQAQVRSQPALSAHCSLAAARQTGGAHSPVMHACISGCKT